jgi:hypothetical protein
MQKLYVPITPAALDELMRRAADERRRPQDQAAVLLEAALGVSTMGQPAPAPRGSREEAADARRS